MNNSDVFIDRRRVTLAMAGTLSLPLLWSCGKGDAEPVEQRARRTALLLAEAQRELCSSVNQSGDGLRGEYFAARRPTGSPILVRTDSAIDFDDQEWATLKRSLGQRPQSARWTGWIKPIIEGSYGFAFRGTRRARVIVARQEMAGASDALSGTRITLLPGRFYPVTIEVDGFQGRRSPVQFEWLLPHGIQQVVPRANLFLPTDQVRA
jgi:hypothetical protein